MKLREPRFLSACGPGALTILLGKGDRFWTREILKYRKTHKPRGWAKTRSLLEDTETAFNNEISAILKKYGASNYKFNYLKKKIRLKEFVYRLSWEKTYLISLTHHFVVYQRGRVFDNCQFASRIYNFRYPNDKVESYVELDGYEKYVEKVKRTA